jgi:outer membrane protein
LRDTEQNVLLNGATAYMNVLRDTAILDLRKNNIIVLEEQLRQTLDRFIVGLVTGTDVAQAESSLASARSDYFTAQANLQTSVANYRQIIGVEPTRLEPVRPIESLLPRSLGRPFVCGASRDSSGIACGGCRRLAGEAGRGRTLSDGQPRRKRSTKL